MLAILTLPMLAFGQTPAYQTREAALLKQQLGINDGQVAQVVAIQKNTLEEVRTSRVHIRLLQAEIDEALLPHTVDQSKINGLVDQIATSQADIEKALLDARIRLRSILGQEGLQQYLALTRNHRRRTGQGSRNQVPRVPIYPGLGNN